MALLKAIHAQEDREAADKKASDVIAKLESMKLAKAARLRYVAGTRWGTRKYMDMSRLTEHQIENAPKNIASECGSVNGLKA